MTTPIVVDRLVITVTGRPAPQGSKRLGEHGQLREQSAYLPAWRAAVKRAAYEQYRALGFVGNAMLPLFRGPVGVRLVFQLATGVRVDGPPDVDKLARSTFDALTAARVWEDDARVVCAELRKVAGVNGGALIEVWAVTP